MKEKNRQFPEQMFSGPFVEIESRKLVIPMEEPRCYSLFNPATKRPMGKESGGLPEDDRAYDLYTREWFDRRGQKRVSAEMKFSRRLSLREQLGGKTPREVLGVTEDADLMTCQRAYRLLVRTVHPDVVKRRVMEVQEQMESGSASEDSKRHMDELLCVLNQRPEIISQDQYAELSDAQKEKYRQELEQSRDNMARTYFARWGEVEKDVMKNAGIQFGKVSLAWKHILNGATQAEIEGVGSLWENRESNNFSEIFMHTWKKQEIDLSTSEALLRRDAGFATKLRGFEGREDLELPYDSRAYLCLCMGKDSEHGIYDVYQEQVPAESFVAFLDRARGVPVSGCYIEGLADHYNLDMVGSARVLDGINNGRDPSDIAGVLQCDPSDEDEYWKRERLKKDVHEIMYGPRFLREGTESYEDYLEFTYAMGIEMQSEGTLVEMYVSSSYDYDGEDKYDYGTNKRRLARRQVFLNRNDMAIIRAVAEGRKLSADSKGQGVLSLI